MPITSVSVYVLKVPLVRQFIFASGAMKDYHGILVRLNAGDVYGWGEASPSGITGETKSSIIKTVKRMALRLKGKNPT
jgi:O-succinylbenzoate synthase